eukprot:TRINITY_DN30491_c0_g1_i1.p1 TRINITY_DN30491_c0_g1~~TRINITY_DN30491_c0_g1_i1.p1  ORF type:complete len:172 (-),score=38.84 TRINITY_DN30491_c0_g1_i1:609-1124(-)
MWMQGIGSAGEVGGGAGGPLVTLGEMLEDLEDEEKALDRASKEPRNSSRAREGRSAVQNGATEVRFVGEEARMDTLFERAFNQLNVALAHDDDNTWPRRTQQLCASLTLADRLVIEAQSSMASLSSQVSTLISVIERGAAASRTVLQPPPEASSADEGFPVHQEEFPESMV